MSGASLALSENAGRFFMPDDSDLQRMILTADLSFTLRADEKRQVPIYAMCTEANDGAPHEATEFSFGEFANGKLLQLVQMVAKNDWQDNARKWQSGASPMIILHTSFTQMIQHKQTHFKNMFARSLQSNINQIKR